MYYIIYMYIYIYIYIYIYMYAPMIEYIANDNDICMI